MSNKTYYRICPNCQSNLDPGELCDCKPTPTVVVNGKRSYLQTDNPNKIKETKGTV